MMTLGTSGSARNESSRLLPPASSTTMPRHDSTLARTSNGWRASSKSPLWMTAASRMSSSSRATRLAPVSTMAESSRCSLVVAVADSMLAALTMALSSVRSWWPKSASTSSRATADSSGSPFGIGIACAGGRVSSSSSFRSMSVEPLRRWLRHWHEHLLGQLDAVGAEMMLLRGAGARGGVVPDRAPVGVDTHLAVRKQLLESDLAVHQAEHLGHADHLAGTAT